MTSQCIQITQERRVIREFIDLDGDLLNWVRSRSLVGGEGARNVGAVFGRCRQFGIDAVERFGGNVAA